MEAEKGAERGRPWAGPRGRRLSEAWQARRRVVLPDEGRLNGVLAGEGRLDGVVGVVG